jgi:hypothetical protein
MAWWGVVGMDFLKVFARTADGNLWQAERIFDGSWQNGFASLAPYVTPGAVVDVACTTSSAPTIPLGTYVLVAQNQPPFLRLLFDGGQGWQAPAAPNVPNAARVAITLGNYPAPAGSGIAVDSRLQMAVVTNDGRLFSAIQINDPSTTTSVPSFNVEEQGAGDRGVARAVALGHRSATSSRLIAAFANGQIYEAIGGQDNWTTFQQFDLAPPDGPGPRPAAVVDVAIPQWDGNVVAIAATDGRVYYTRYNAGAWSSWIDLETVFVPFPVTPHVGSFSRLSVCKESGGGHDVLGVTSDGHLWYKFRPSFPVGVFTDVEARVGPMPVDFTAVSGCT